MVPTPKLFIAVVRLLQSIEIMNDRQSVVGQNTIIALYAIPDAVMRALSELWKSGCEVTFSVFARDGEEINPRKDFQDDSWAPLLLCLPGWSSFVIPSIGHVLISGQMSIWLGAILEKRPMFGGVNPLRACFNRVGIAGKAIPTYEAAVRAGGILLVAHGPLEEVVKARDILSRDITRTSAKKHASCGAL